MKRWLLFVLVFGLLFATSMPVSAAGKGPFSNFTLVGRIVEIGDGEVTIQVLRGNKLVQPNVEQELVVSVTSNTRYLEKVGDVVIPITFEDLAPGDPVSVHGKVVNDILTATRITVGAQLIHFP